jgi:predicted AAA+ superfamily ATPase
MGVTAVLLFVMESGDILETKYKRQRGLKLDLAVFAAGNADKAIAPELISRFGGGVLYFKPYSKDEFMNVCQSYLSRYEGVPLDIGSLIAEQTWFQLNRDVRTARGVARRLREHTAAEVYRIVGFLRKYAKGI